MISANLQKMTLQEKLQMVSVIWDSIANDSDEDISPSWHKDELRKRQSAIQNKSIQFEDWSVVKKELQELVR